nr:vacuolar-processing enzyme [Tanacetum cinerariifolium]
MIIEYNPRYSVVIDIYSNRALSGVWNIFDTHLVQLLSSQDYTREDVTVENFFTVLLGNKIAVNGGSGKFVNIGPNDNIFFTILITAGQVFLLLYLEACEFGSIFEVLLPHHLVRMRTVGVLIALKDLLVLPQNIILVRVTCTVLRRWKTGKKYRSSLDYDGERVVYGSTACVLDGE